MDGFGPHRAHLLEFDVRARHYGGEQADQLGARCLVHHGDVEQAVGVVGGRADPHSAAVAAGVAEGGQCDLGVDLLRAVEHQAKR
ncbi:hypothetical protein AFC82_19515 [Mycobacterium avium subsp. paratuberculosis]|nr:hypothetical protein AFC82_19515 [Mycobacterium avium subsp. paratuberculosis]